MILLRFSRPQAQFSRSPLPSTMYDPWDVRDVCVYVCVCLTFYFRRIFEKSKISIPSTVYDTLGCPRRVCVYVCMYVNIVIPRLDRGFTNWEIFIYTHIYGSRAAQNVQERCLCVCYDKNACKRAQEHGQTRSGVGEPSHFVS